MNLQLGTLLVIMALLPVPLAWSQIGAGDAPQSGSADSSQQQSANGPQPTFTHPEQRPPLAMLDELTQHNFLSVGLGATVAWDSNANTFGYQGYSRTLFVVNPSLELRQTRPTVTWWVSANGGLTTSTGQGYYDTSNPSANAGITYNINKHWQLNAYDTYLYTSDPYQQYLVYANTPTYNQPNPAVYVPLTTTQQNSGVLDLTYRIGPHDSLTFTGTESFRRFLHNDAYSNYNLTTWGGSSAYQHVFTARFSAGGAYSYGSLDFGHGQSRSGIQTIEAFANYQLNPHMTIGGWIGPQYTATKNKIPVFCTPYGCFIEVFHNAMWDVAYGGNFGWSGQRNGATVSFSKAVSDGGVGFGIAHVYTVNGNYVRQLNPRWSFLAGGLWGVTNGAASKLTIHQHLNSFTGFVGFTRLITPTLNASMQYLRYYETQKYLYPNSGPKWTDNRIQFTLQYNWGHSLGR